MRLFLTEKHATSRPLPPAKPAQPIQPVIQPQAPVTQGGQGQAPAGPGPGFPAGPLSIQSAPPLGGDPNLEAQLNDQAQKYEDKIQELQAQKAKAESEVAQAQLEADKHKSYAEIAQKARDSRQQIEVERGRLKDTQERMRADYDKQRQALAAEAAKIQAQGVQARENIVARKERDFLHHQQMAERMRKLQVRPSSHQGYVDRITKKIADITANLGKSASVPAPAPQPPVNVSNPPPAPPSIALNKPQPPQFLPPNTPAIPPTPTAESRSDEIARRFPKLKEVDPKLYEQVLKGHAPVMDSFNRWRDFNLKQDQWRERDAFDSTTKGKIYNTVTGYVNEPDYFQNTHGDGMLSGAADWANQFTQDTVRHLWKAGDEYRHGGYANPRVWGHAAAFTGNAVTPFLLAGAVRGLAPAWASTRAAGATVPGAFGAIRSASGFGQAARATLPAAGSVFKTVKPLSGSLLQGISAYTNPWLVPSLADTVIGGESFQPDRYSKQYKIGDEYRSTEDELADIAREAEAQRAAQYQQMAANQPLKARPTDLAALQYSGYFQPKGTFAPGKYEMQFANPMWDQAVKFLLPFVTPKADNLQYTGEAMPPYNHHSQVFKRLAEAIRSQPYNVPVHPAIFSQ